jgi:phage shock protein C
MFCPHCGKQSAPDARFCSSCGAPAANPYAPAQSRIVRPRHPRVIAGVCSGIAIHYGWDIILVRILFAVFTFLTSGLGILLYIAAWAILPDAPYALPPVRSNYGPTPPQPTQGTTV